VGPFNDDDNRGNRTRELQRKLWTRYAGICYPKE